MKIVNFCKKLFLGYLLFQLVLTGVLGNFFSTFSIYNTNESYLSVSVVAAEDKKGGEGAKTETKPSSDPGKTETKPSSDPGKTEIKPSSGSSSSSSSKGGGSVRGFDISNLQTFAECNFAKATGIGAVIECLRSVLIFIAIISIIVGFFRIVFVAIGAFIPGYSSSVDPLVAFRERLLDFLIGIPFMGASILLLYLLNPATVNINFLDLAGVSKFTPSSSSSSGSKEAKTSEKGSSDKDSASSDSKNTSDRSSRRERVANDPVTGDWPKNNIDIRNGKTVGAPFVLKTSDGTEVKKVGGGQVYCQNLVFTYSFDKQSSNSKITVCDDSRLNNYWEKYSSFIEKNGNSYSIKTGPVSANQIRDIKPVGSEYAGVDSNFFIDNVN